MTVRHALVRSGVVMLLGAVTLTLCMCFPNAAENSESGMVLRLPGRDGVAGYVGILRAKSKEEEKWLPADTGLRKMLYVPLDVKVASEAEAMEKGISASLILSGMDRRSLHRPEVCLRAQGWRITSKDTVTIDVGEQELEVADFTIARKVNEPDGSIRDVRAHYLYWWIGAKRSTPSDFERILFTVLDNMFRNLNNRWGYPSVLVYADLKEGMTPDQITDADNAARERALSFVRQYAPIFQKSLGAIEVE